MVRTVCQVINNQTIGGSFGGSADCTDNRRIVQTNRRIVQTIAGLFRQSPDCSDNRRIVQTIAGLFRQSPDCSDNRRIVQTIAGLFSFPLSLESIPLTLEKLEQLWVLDSVS